MLLRGKMRSKKKHDTLCNDFNDTGRKHGDICKKIAASKCPWIRRLYE